MLPVKKSNFLAATLKREKAAERRERKRTEKDGKAERSGKTSGKKKIERGMERWRFKRTAMKRRGVRRGGEVNSVKYPQLDATHWHTVSMQILFTLGSPPPFVSLYLSLSFSPSRHRDSHRAPHRTLVLRSLLFLSPVTSRGKRSDARRTCAHPVCITHTPLAPPLPFHTLPRNPIVPLFMPISSFSFTCNKRDEVDVTDSPPIIYNRHILYSYRMIYQ